jgi:hypothetical protein
VQAYKVEDLLPRLPATILDFFWHSEVPSDKDLEIRKQGLTMYCDELLGLVRETLKVL